MIHASRTEPGVVYRIDGRTAVARGEVHGRYVFDTVNLPIDRLTLDRCDLVARVDPGEDLGDWPWSAGCLTALLWLAAAVFLVYAYSHPEMF